MESFAFEGIIGCAGGQPERLMLKVFRINKKFTVMSHKFNRRTFSPGGSRGLCKT